MLTIRPDSYVQPKYLEFQNAERVSAKVQQEIGKQSWPIAEYALLQNKLDSCLAKGLVQSHDIDWFPQELINLCCLKRIDVTEEHLAREIGTYLYTQVASEYQRQGVKFIIERNGRGLIADVPGLGKTLQAIMIMWYYRRQWPALVICPALPKLTWVLELQKWLTVPYFPACPQPISRLITNYLAPIRVLQTSKQLPVRNAWITVVSYDLLRSPEVFTYITKRLRPQVVVVDECHFAKHEKAKRTKAVTEVTASAKHVVMLSGTPMTHNQDMYGQVHCLYPEFFPRRFYNAYPHYLHAQKQPPHRRTFYFAEYFCAGTYRQQRLKYGGRKIWLPQTGGASRQDVLHQILTNHILIQRTQQVLAGTSDEVKEVERIRYVMPNPEKKQPLDNLPKLDVKTAILELYHELAPIKALLVSPFLQYYFAGLLPAKKTLIWGQHHVVLDAVADYCTENKIGYIRIDGSVPDKQRVQIVEQFKSDSRIKVAILSLLACNTSLNLQVAGVNIFMQLHWDVFQLDQAEKRCARRGQKEQVRSYYVIAQDTLDRLLWTNITKAYKNASLVTQGNADYFLAQIIKLAAQLE